MLTAIYKFSDASFQKWYCMLVVPILEIFALPSDLTTEAAFPTRTKFVHKMFNNSFFLLPVPFEGPSLYATAE